jgi:hypothetical protein
VVVAVEIQDAQTAKEALEVMLWRIVWAMLMQKNTAGTTVVFRFELQVILP